jgi:hypothetical protein
MARHETGNAYVVLGRKFKAGAAAAPAAASSSGAAVKRERTVAGVAAATSSGNSSSDGGGGGGGSGGFTSGTSSVLASEPARADQMYVGGGAQIQFGVTSKKRKRSEQRP